MWFYSIVTFVTAGFKVYWAQEEDSSINIYIEHSLISDWGRCKILNMNPLIKTTLLRTFVFLVLTSLSTWLFVYVEHTEEDNKEEKLKLLLSLYESMASKYNMTISEFNNFSNVAYEALSEPKPRWTYLHAIDFVFQAFSTIGKGNIFIPHKE